MRTGSAGGSRARAQPHSDSEAQEIVQRYRQEKQRILSRQPSGVLSWGSQYHATCPASLEPSHRRGSLAGAHIGFSQQPSDRPCSHWQAPRAHGGQEEASHQWRRVFGTPPGGAKPSRAAAWAESSSSRTGGQQTLSPRRSPQVAATATYAPDASSATARWPTEWPRERSSSGPAGPDMTGGLVAGDATAMSEAVEAAAVRVDRLRRWLLSHGKDNKATPPEGIESPLGHSFSPRTRQEARREDAPRLSASFRAEDPDTSISYSRLHERFFPEEGTEARKQGNGRTLRQAGLVMASSPPRGGPWGGLGSSFASAPACCRRLHMELQSLEEALQDVLSLQPSKTGSGMRTLGAGEADRALGSCGSSRASVVQGGREEGEGQGQRQQQQQQQQHSGLKRVSPWLRPERGGEAAGAPAEQLKPPSTRATLADVGISQNQEAWGNLQNMMEALGFHGGEQGPRVQGRAEGAASGRGQRHQQQSDSQRVSLWCLSEQGDASEQPKTCSTRENTADPAIPKNHQEAWGDLQNMMEALCSHSRNQGSSGEGAGGHRQQQQQQNGFQRASPRSLPEWAGTTGAAKPFYTRTTPADLRIPKYQEALGDLHKRIEALGIEVLNDRSFDNGTARARAGMASSPISSERASMLQPTPADVSPQLSPIKRSWI